jgi:cytoskeletal protein CcmA (bactofilin family)
MVHARDTTTLIGAGAHIRGDLTFTSDAIVCGKIEGRIASTGELRIALEAECHARVQGKSIVIDGSVDGDVVGIHRVVLSATARVRGDVTTPSLLMIEGAMLVGHCAIGAEPVNGLEPGREE